MTEALLNPMDELLDTAAGTQPALLLRRLIGSYRITHAIKAATASPANAHRGTRTEPIATAASGTARI